METEKKEKFGSHLTHEDRVRNGRKGGMKKGENYKTRKTMKDAIQILMAMPLEKKTVKELEDILAFSELKGKNLTVNDAIIVRQIQRALKGDLNAVAFLRDTSGQKPKEDVAVDMNIPVIIAEDLKE